MFPAFLSEGVLYALVLFNDCKHLPSDRFDLPADIGTTIAEKSRGWDEDRCFSICICFVTRFRTAINI
jgi:hypothetical protein